MSSNQSAMYKKFIVGAASAALVASAVAPVASAKDFKDTKGNTHETAIDALSDAGVITGYPNGTFLPNKTLTRSDVVKLMGKWLVSEGYKVPTDYKTKMRFSDLTSKSNDELLQYAAVVKDNGVFNGSNGNLLAGDNITRENMAVVIVRAFDTVKDIELVKYVKEQDFKKDVTDLTKAKAEARTAIDVLDYFDITNPAAPAFNPKNTTTRGHFATFLHKSINTDFSEVKAPVVDVDKVAVDAAAEQVKAGAVTVARGNYATDANKLAAVEAYVTSLVTEKDVVATVVAGKTAGEYVVTLTKGEAKAEKTIAMTFDFAADDRFVTEVNALNAKEVQVTFTQAVKRDSVLDASNKIKGITFRSLDAKKITSANSTGVLSEDGKTLTITATGTEVFEGRYDVNIKDVKTTDGEKVEEFTQVITFAIDKTAPTITKVEKKDASNTVVTFSEPLSVKGNWTFKLADGTNVTSKVNVSDLSVDKKSVTLTVNDIEAGKEITGTVIGAKDAVGNLLSPNPETVKITKGDKDGIAPTVASVTTVGLNQFELKFSEEVQGLLTANLKIDGTAVHSIEQNDKDKTKYIVTVKKDGVLSTGLHTLTIDKDVVTDLSGEKLAAYSKVINFVEDKVAPKLEKSEVKTDKDGKETLYLTFDEAVKAGTISDLVAIEKDKNLITRTGTVKLVLKAVEGNEKQVQVALDDAKFTASGTPEAALKEGASYSVKLANVKDLSNNELKETTISFTRSADEAVQNKAEVESVIAVEGNNNEVTVTFKKAVDGTTATDAKNYKIADVEVEEAILNPIATDAKGKQTVTLKLKKDSNSLSGDRVVTISGVKAKNGLLMEDYNGIVELNENVAPTVTKAELTATDKITLTFSEAVTDNTNVANDFEVLIGGESQATTPHNVNSGIGATATTKVVISIADLDADKLAKGVSLKALSTLDIKDAAGNKLSVPASILVTQ